MDTFLSILIEWFVFFNLKKEILQDLNQLPGSTTHSFYAFLGAQVLDTHNNRAPRSPEER